MSTAFWILLCVLSCFPDCSPQNLILATDFGIKTLHVPTSTLTTLHEGAATSVDFRYISKDVYFISNSTKQLFYSYYSEYNKNLSIPITRLTSLTNISCLAVDWVSYRLYYGIPGVGSLFKETLRASPPEEIVSHVFELNNFALDPYERVLFFTTKGYLLSVTLDGAVVNRHHLTNRGLKEVTALSLDLHTKEVFVVCQRKSDNEWMLLTKGHPSTSEPTTVYVGRHLQGVRALTVYNGLIFWASPCGEAHCLYSCQRNTCQEDNVTISWRTFEVINDVKFYSPLVQTPDIESACTLCSHGCSQDSASCFCPVDMEVGDDGVQCTKKSPSLEVRLRDLLDGIVDGCYQWYDSKINPYVYPCGGLVLAVLFCCLCLLTTIPCSKPVMEDDDYPLSESLHADDCPRRDTQPLDSIEECPTETIS